MRQDRVADYGSVYVFSARPGNRLFFRTRTSIRSRRWTVLSCPQRSARRAACPIGAPIARRRRSRRRRPDGAIYVSAGKQVLRLAGAGYEARSVFAEFDGAAGGLAFHPDGRLLVCVAGRGLGRGRRRRPAVLAQSGRRPKPLQCLTCVAAAADGSIFMTDGSTSARARGLACAISWRRTHLGRLVACGAGLDGAQVPVARPVLSARGCHLRPTARRSGSPKAGTHRISRAAVSGRGIGGAANRSSATCRGYPARLRILRGGAGSWFSVFARAHASGRVRAARGRFPPGDDGDHPARPLDSARARHQRSLPRADAVRLRSRRSGSRSPGRRLVLTALVRIDEGRRSCGEFAQPGLLAAIPWRHRRLRDRAGSGG